MTLIPAHVWGRKFGIKAVDQFFWTPSRLHVQVLVWCDFCPCCLVVANLAGGCNFFHFSVLRMKTFYLTKWKWINTLLETWSGSVCCFPPSQDYSVPEISLFPEENAEGKKVVFRDTSEDARIFGFPIKANSVIINAGLWVGAAPYRSNQHMLLEKKIFKKRKSFHKCLKLNSCFSSSAAQMAGLRPSFLPGGPTCPRGRGLHQPWSMGSGDALRGLSASTENSKCGRQGETR